MQIEKNVETSRDTRSDKIETHGRFIETRKKWEKSRNELKKKKKKMNWINCNKLQVQRN